MIIFSSILGAGLLGIIILLVLKRKQAKVTYWYIIDWASVYLRSTDSLMRHTKRAMLTVTVFIISGYRKTRITGTRSAKRLVRRVLFPRNHTGRHERPSSDFLNDIIEHKKELDAQPKKDS